MLAVCRIHLMDLRPKVNRAKSRLASLQAALRDFFDSNSYEVVLGEFDEQAGHHELRVEGGPTSFPDEWGVVIGEIAHDLRSALDGLTWQLALRNVSEPYRNTCFPIFRVGRTKRSLPGGGRNSKR